MIVSRTIRKYNTHEVRYMLEHYLPSKNVRMNTTNSFSVINVRNFPAQNYTNKIPQNNINLIQTEVCGT